MTIDPAASGVENRGGVASSAATNTVEAAADCPPPPYPTATKSGGFHFELDIERMQQSDTWAIADPQLRPFLLMIWVVSWTQIPAGSLPGIDAVIAGRIGMSASEFGANRDVLMRGWSQASDGRMYHPVLTELVLGMIQRKARKATNQANYRQRQQAESAPERLRSGQATACDVTGHYPVTDPEVTGNLRVTDPTTTTTTTTTTTRNKKLVPEPEGSAQLNVVDLRGEQTTQADPTQIRIPLKCGSEYEVTSCDIAEWRAAYPAKDVVMELRLARAWCISNPNRRKTRGRVRGFLNGWLARSFPSDQRPKSDYFNPDPSKFVNIKGGLL